MSNCANTSMTLCAAGKRQRELYNAIDKGSLCALLAGVQPGENAREREREQIVRTI